MGTVELPPFQCYTDLVHGQDLILGQPSFTKSQLDPHEVTLLSVASYVRFITEFSIWSVTFYSILNVFC